MRNRVNGIATDLTRHMNETHRDVEPGGATVSSPVLATPATTTTTVLALTLTAQYTCFTAGSTLGNETMTEIDELATASRDDQPISLEQLEKRTIASALETV